MPSMYNKMILSYLHITWLGVNLLRKLWQRTLRLQDKVVSVVLVKYTAYDFQYDHT